MVVGYIKAAYRGWKAAPTDMEYNYSFCRSGFPAAINKENLKGFTMSNRLIGLVRIGD